MDSLGAALGVAQRLGGTTGATLATAARSAFIGGMTLALTIGAGVLAAGALLTLVVLPSRPPSDQSDR